MLIGGMLRSGFLLSGRLAVGHEVAVGLVFFDEAALKPGQQFGLFDGSNLMAEIEVI